MVVVGHHVGGELVLWTKGTSVVGLDTSASLMVEADFGVGERISQHDREASDVQRRQRGEVVSPGSRERA